MRVSDLQCMQHFAYTLSHLPSLRDSQLWDRSRRRAEDQKLFITAKVEIVGVCAVPTEFDVIGERLNGMTGLSLNARTFCIMCQV